MLPFPSLPGPDRKAQRLGEHQAAKGRGDPAELVSGFRSDPTAMFLDDDDGAPLPRWDGEGTPGGQAGQLQGAPGGWSSASRLLCISLFGLQTAAGPVGCLGRMAAMAPGTSPT